MPTIHARQSGPSRGHTSASRIRPVLPAPSKPPPQQPHPRASQKTFRSKTLTVIYVSGDTVVLRNADGGLQLLGLPADETISVNGQPVAPRDLKPGTTLTHVHVRSVQQLHRHKRHPDRRNRSALHYAQLGDPAARRWHGRPFHDSAAREHSSRWQGCQAIRSAPGHESVRHCGQDQRTAYSLQSDHCFRRRCHAPTARDAAHLRRAGQGIGSSLVRKPASRRRPWLQGASPADLYLIPYLFGSPR